MEAIFAPLRTSIEARELTDIDMLDVIIGLTNTEPLYGIAFATSARDVLLESESSGTDVSYGAVVAEGYRRTFFDIDTARPMGTDGLLQQGPQALKNFADHLIAGYVSELN